MVFLLVPGFLFLVEQHLVKQNLVFLNNTLWNKTLLVVPLLVWCFWNKTWSSFLFFERFLKQAALLVLETNPSFLETNKQNLVSCHFVFLKQIVVFFSFLVVFFSSCSWNKPFLKQINKSFDSCFVFLKHHLPIVSILYCKEFKVFLIKMTGFEPVTLCTQNRYATRLRYILYF